MVNRDDIFKHLKTRAEYYKDKDDYSGIFSVAQVLWLIEEIERLKLSMSAHPSALEISLRSIGAERFALIVSLLDIESNRIDDWKMQRLSDLSSQL